jgi:ABC-type multidrug transport system fused ATPase/permease subunit
MRPSEKKKKKASLAAVKYAFVNIILPRKWLLLLGLLLIIINRLAGLILPGSTKILIDEVIPGGAIDKLYLLLAVVGGAVTIQAVSSFFLTQLLSVEAQNLIAQLRLKVQQQVLHMPVKFFDNNRSGALVSRIMSDVEGVRNLVGTGLVQLFGGILTSVVALVLLLNINAQLTIYAILPMIFFGFIALKAFQYIRPIFRERSVINAEVTGRLTETLSGIRVIKGFNAEQQEVLVFEKGVDKLFRNVKKTLISTSLVTSASTLLLGVGSVLIMGFGGSKIMQGSMTVGDFFAFTLYLGFLIAPILQMSNIGSQITEAFAGLDRMEELLKEEKENENPNRKIALPHIKGDIIFDNVSFAYEQEKAVLNGISFEAKAGSITALVGSSGSGKSTIAGLAASYLTPQKGMVSIDGIDLSTVTLDSYRKHLGVVLQDDFLFEGTIRENILFPRPKANNEQLQNAVVAAHVNEFTDRFELGLDTLIGERGVKLSGGQRQRIAIARALLADPRILILDEATSSLDAESESYIQSSLQKLMQGRTTFVIAHRLSTIRQADQILVIEQGLIVERGTHDQLLESKGRYYQLFTYQSRI